MTENLKPCPFCGSEAVYHEGWSNYIKCSQCKTYLRIHEEKDIFKWNNRVDLVAVKRAGIVNNARACPLCSSFRVMIDLMDRAVYCHNCGLRLTLGSLHNGPVQEILDAWNARTKQ